jgi:hypothetical protein
MSTMQNEDIMLMDSIVSLKMNTAQWWSEHDFIVPNGEIVVVQCGTRAYLKRGDGKHLLS